MTGHLPEDPRRRFERALTAVDPTRQRDVLPSQSRSQQVADALAPVLREVVTGGGYARVEADERHRSADGSESSVKVVVVIDGRTPSGRMSGSDPRP